jgi:hypothetical protein
MICIHHYGHSSLMHPSNGRDPQTIRPSKQIPKMHPINGRNLLSKEYQIPLIIVKQQGFLPLVSDAQRRHTFAAFSAWQGAKIWLKIA